MTSLLPALGLAAILGALAWYAFRIEPGWLEVRRIEVPLRRLPAELDGLVVAQISDLHAGERGRPGLLRRAIDACNAARPDLVAITGDITHRGYELDEALALLRRLTVRPAYVVLGNHDYMVGEGRPRALAKALRELGMVVLRNEAVSHVARDGGRLWIVGLDDPCTRRDDLRRALASLGPADCPRLLLTHSLETAPSLRPGDADLVLSGHTHGGQVFIPIVTAFVLSRHYSRFNHGSYWHQGAFLYVNRGLGSLGLPRFLRRPEVTLLTLRAQAGGARSP